MSASSHDNKLHCRTEFWCMPGVSWIFLQHFFGCWCWFLRLRFFLLLLIHLLMSKQFKTQQKKIANMFLDRPFAVKWLFIAEFYFIFFSVRYASMLLFLSVDAVAIMTVIVCQTMNGKYKIFGNKYLCVCETPKASAVAMRWNKNNKWTATMSVQRFSIHGRRK